ncbi:MAG: SDR family oxidoreductase [Bacteroidota bacterium]|nr:SDR family oxidoreductase [Bacteroidota bacterium]
MRLAEKTIIVTGSAAGIGRTMASVFVREGANVIVTDRNEKEAKMVADELGAGAALHVDELSDPAASRRIVEAALSSFGRIDGLVNNAAFIPRSNIHTTDVALFDKVMHINVRAPMLLIQAALPHLTATKGSVLNIGSINAYCGEPPLLGYSVSKGALMTLSRNLGDALFAEYGVRVNQINPGWILTNNEYKLKLADGLPPDWPSRLPVGVAPSGGLIGPETIAQAAIYWLSDESLPISGTVVDLEQYPMIGRNPPKEVST